MTDDRAGAAIVPEPNDLLKRSDLDAETRDELEQVAHRYGITDLTEMAKALLIHGLNVVRAHHTLEGDIRAYLDVLKAEAEDAEKATKH